MNGIKCPNCDLVNLLTATVCHRCQVSLNDLPPTAEVSVPIEQTFEAQTVVRQNQQFGMPAPNNAPEIPRDNELGRKTFFWYRVYLAVMTVLCFLLVGLGGTISYFSQFDSSPQAEENIIVGIIYAVLGGIFAVIFAIGLFLPRKSWNWIVGIIYIAISFTSCCFLPATVPLLVYWLKPETQAYFGRK